MLPSSQAALIADRLTFMDCLCRSDLHEGSLTGERDYVSRLMTHITYPYGPWFPKFAFWVMRDSKTLPGDLERKFGTDAIIVFQSGGEVKVGMFEAKWPRVIISTKPWDSRYFGKVYSRFSKQIRKQRNWTNQVAIWEMFFYENINGKSTSFFNPFGSTCVWHDDVYTYFLANRHLFKRNIWNNNDLTRIFSKGGKRKKGKNFRSIIYQILTCKKGKECSQ